MGLQWYPEPYNFLAVQDTIQNYLALKEPGTRQEQILRGHPEISDTVGFMENPFELLLALSKPQPFLVILLLQKPIFTS